MYSIFVSPIFLPHFNQSMMLKKPDCTRVIRLCEIHVSLLDLILFVFWPYLSLNSACNSVAFLVFLSESTYLKVEKILKGSLDLIPSTSVNIQIMGGKC